MTIEQRVAELERQMGCVARWMAEDPDEYDHKDCAHDLTTPPPPKPPEIETAKITANSWRVACGNRSWRGDVWTTHEDGYWYSRQDADAVAEKLRAKGMYPKEHG